MKIDYTDDVRKNYMVIEPEDEGESFEESMLTSVKLKGLLDLELRYEDGKKKYYYDISGMSPISESANIEELGCREIEDIILQLKNVFDELSGYMISETSLCIRKDCIYTDEDIRLKFCVVPGESFDIKYCITELAGLLLIKVKEEPEAVMLARELFEISRRERFDIGELLNACERRRKGEVLGRSESGAEPCIEAGYESVNKREAYNIEAKKVRESSPGQGEEDFEDINLYTSEKSDEHKNTKRKSFFKKEEKREGLDVSFEREAEKEYKHTDKSAEGNDHIKRIAAAALIMVAVPLVIYILRGEAALIRFIPVLAVADIGILLYNMVGLLERYNMMKKEREQTELVNRAEF